MTERCAALGPAGEFPIHPRPMFLRPRALLVGLIAPCLPTKAPHPPSGELWLHGIKHDGFRVIARKDGKPGEALQSAGRAISSFERCEAERLSRAAALISSLRCKKITAYFLLAR